MVFTNSFAYASRWSLKDGFSSPEVVVQGAGLAFAADSAGNAFVATVVNPYPQPAAVAVARFDTNRGWLPPVVLRSDEQGGDVHLLALATDPTGNALVLWDLAGVDNYEALYAASFRPSVGWGSPHRIDLNPSLEGTTAWNERGEAAVVWPQRSPSRLWASRLDSAGEWGTPQALQADASVWCPAVESDGSGGFIAAWLQGELNTKSRATWAARFSPRQGWGVPALVASATSVACPVLAATPDGHPLLFWRQSTEEPSPAGFSGWQVYMSRLVDE